MMVHMHTQYITTKVKANIPDEASLTNYELFHKFTKHVSLSVHAVSLSARQDYPLGRKSMGNILG